MKILYTALLFPTVIVLGWADQWPALEYKKVWDRPLGEGYSQVKTDSERLYTLYRQKDDEFLVALNPKSGETLWEHGYSAKPDPDQTRAYGQGPNAAPLVHKERVLAIGFTGILNCLDSKTGNKIWSKNLIEAYGGLIQYYGYSNQPIAYEDTIIALVGSDDMGAVALNLKDGTEAWRSPPFDNSYAPPVLINVDGQDQVVFFTPDHVMAIAAKNGVVLWDYPVKNR